MSGDVVAVLTYRTFQEGHDDDHTQLGQAIVARLVADPSLPSVTVVDPFRSRLTRLRHQPPPDACLDNGLRRRLVRPLRWARGDPVGRDMVRAYRRLERRLRTEAAPDSVLVSCHPVLAALAARSGPRGTDDRPRPGGWADVVYYGWDDWRTEDEGLFARAGGAIAWSYRELAARDVNVVTVAPAIADRIGADRSTVVPNGVDPAAFTRLPPVPGWFDALPGRVAFWAGSVQGRLDAAALAACARELGAGWSLVLVGPVVDPAPLAVLRDLPNVVVRGWHPRGEVLAMARASDVCLLPHVRSEVTEAMSPLKLYEYLATGTPVVAADLGPVRDVSPRVVLVPPGGPYAPAVRAAAALPAATAAELAAVRHEHSLDARYARFRSAALSAVPAVNLPKVG